MSQNTTDQEDGSCPLMIFLPFSGICDPLRFWQDLVSDDTGAFDHLASALLAMHHFNERNPVVVSELATDPVLQNCSSSFPIDRTSVTDTRGRVIFSAQAIYERIREGNDVCALVGSVCDGVALELSSQASGLDVPLVLHASRDSRLTSPRFYPHTTRSCMNRFFEAEVIYRHLQEIGRNNFVGMIYIIQEVGTQIQETLATEFSDAAVSHFVSAQYSPPFVGTEPRSAYAAMKAVKDAGYRTIVLTVTTDEHLHHVANAAQALGTNNGDYYYVITGLLTNEVLRVSANQSANITKLLHGAAVLTDLDGFQHHAAMEQQQPDPFLTAWQQQGPDFVRQVQRFNPIRPGRPGYVNATDTYFQENTPAHLSSFMYDAVMTVGIGHCRLQAKQQRQQQQRRQRRQDRRRTLQQETNTPKGGGGGIKGQRPSTPKANQQQQQQQNHRRAKKDFQSLITNDLLVSMMEAEFHGASGQVAYNEGFRPTNRIRGTITYGRYNFRTRDNGDGTRSMEYVLTDVLTDGTLTGRWTSVPGTSFVYADGTALPPALLRDPPAQNYIQEGIFLTGLILFGVAVAWTLLAILFVCVYWKHQAIKSNQPEFLLILLCGALTMAFAIVTFSFDESRGWTQDELTVACIATPWLISLGFISVYCALFSKLWRINKVLQFRTRVQVTIYRVMGPFVVMVVSAICLLSVWTGIDPLTWRREEINEQTGESFGKCRSDNMNAYLIPIAVLMAISVLMTCFMAWQTKDVDERFSESRWIFYTLFSQGQILLVGIPILALLGDDNVNVLYVARIMLLWLVVMTTVTVMFLPKAADVFSIGVQKTESRGGTTGGNVQITGFSRQTQGISGSRIQVIHAQHSANRLAVSSLSNPDLNMSPYTASRMETSIANIAENSFSNLEGSIDFVADQETTSVDFVVDQETDNDDKRDDGDDGIVG